MRLNCRQTGGFSLIELLVVIGIISLLASLLLVGSNLTRKAARDSNRREDVQTLASLFELYKVENGRYPVCEGGMRISGGFQSSTDCEEYTDVTAFLTQNLEVIPEDPLTGSGWFYYYDSSKTCFGAASVGMVFARTEVAESDNKADSCPRDPADPCSDNDGNYNCDNGEEVSTFGVILERSI